MKTVITATAPTAYQIRSLSAFGIETKKHLNGSFSIKKEFNNEKEAKLYLINRAEIYYDEYPEQVNEYLEQIEKYGSLTLDAVTARIEEIE